MEQIFTDFTIHSIYEKQGTHILDIDKFKLALKNSIKINCTKRKISELHNDNVFDDALRARAYIDNHIGHLEKNKEMYSFIILYSLEKNSDFIAIDSLFYRFFKNLTLETMIEIRNLILNTVKKKKAFEFSYDGVIFYVYYNKVTQIFGTNYEHTMYLKHIYSFFEKHNLLIRLANLFKLKTEQAE